VQQMAIQLREKNRQGGQELDRVFMLRKQRESDTAKVVFIIISSYQQLTNCVIDRREYKCSLSDSAEENKRVGARQTKSL
jgi:hypothetical protein